MGLAESSPDLEPSLNVSMSAESSNLPVLKALFVSTSVGPLGTGMGGGVELTLANLAKALQLRGHLVNVLAPMDSSCDGLNIYQVPGQLQSTAQAQGRAAKVEMPADAVIANLWEQARQMQGDYDIILNFAYDWLPLYLTPFFETPVVHLISMGSLTEAMDCIIEQTLDRFPHCIAVHSGIQAETFEAIATQASDGIAHFSQRCTILANGFDLSRYQFQPNAKAQLGWVGRIAPEKGLEDAVAAIAQTQTPLKIWGAMEHPDYWAEIQQRYPDAPIEYCGFLSTDELQQQLGYCQGLVMTPKWVEAFGNVAIEALACGVPVISYGRGGPLEIIEDGLTGYLVEPDSVEGLVGAIAKLDRIDRVTCRAQTEAKYSLAAMGERTEAWLRKSLV